MRKSSVSPSTQSGLSPAGRYLPLAFPLPPFLTPALTNPEPPPHINLIIAVSFGLKVPIRVLKLTPFPGLNVHPSLLPTFRGAAPIYHALLSGAPSTGVSIQTLDPYIIDNGHIILQSTPIAIPPKTSYSALHDHLAILGAQMLVHTLRGGLFVPPIVPLLSPYPPSYAPKIVPLNHARVKWGEQSAEDLERYAGVLGTMWVRVGELGDLDRRPRGILSQMEVWKGPTMSFEMPGVQGSQQMKEEPTIPEDESVIRPGTWRYVKLQDGDEALIIKCKEGWIRVHAFKIEGRPLRQAGEWARSKSVGAGDPQVFT